MTRRFGIWQGRGDSKKCRPIGNYKESCVNATTSASDTITVHSVDCVAAGLALKMSCDQAAGRSPKTVLRCWDLKKTDCPVKPDTVLFVSRENKLCLQSLRRPGLFTKFDEAG